MRIIFWGVGNTAKKCVNQIKDLSNQFEVVAFVDSSIREMENEVLWEGYRVLAPQKIACLDIDYLCILSIWEWEIRQKIYDENLFALSRIVSFHEICMMNCFGADLGTCYKKQLELAHPMQVESIRRWQVYEHLKRTYSYVLCDNSYWNVNVNKKVFFEEDIKPIWVLWLQGFKEAPELVKVCVHSMKRILGKKECLCLLDQYNLFEYIDLPHYIIQKWKEGIIDNRKFANLVRLRLLNAYGGVWIDATVYFTGNHLPNYIKNSKLFMYSIWREWSGRNEPMISANWLIAAQPANKMLMILEALHYEYWKKENKAISYVFFHIFWTIVVERFPDEWDQVETILRDSSRLLSKDLKNKFDDERFRQLKQMSDVHKLSYKLPYKEYCKDTFWGKICEIEGSGCANFNETYYIKDR